VKQSFAKHCPTMPVVEPSNSRFSSTQSACCKPSSDHKGRIVALFLLVLLSGTSLAMIVWGFWERDRIYQFPTLAGVAWLGYIVPQAIGILNNPQSAPGAVFRDGGLELALLMSTLCAGLSFLGYVSLSDRYRPPAPVASYSCDRLFVFGLLFYVIAFVAFHRLAQLSGGYIAYFVEGGAYTLRWRGMPVVYSFFAQLVFPGLLLCLYSALHSRSVLKWSAVAVGCLFPLANTIFLGRRQNTVVLLLIMAVTVFLVKRWAPPRLVSLAVIVLGALSIALAPAYRANIQMGDRQGKLTDIDVQRRVADKLEGRSTWVLENAVVQMAAVRRAGQYGMGRGLYNRLIQLLVPRLIVGDEVKERLLLRAPEHRDLTWRYYRWVTKYGTYSTGACDAFREFWFFGALVFFVIGRGFRVLWDRAYLAGSVPARLLYVSLCVIAMTSVVNNIGGIPAQLIVVLTLLIPVICLSCVGPRLPDPRESPCYFEEPAPLLGAAPR
jgi:hypothetical protein